jgi:hypothetical protein
MNAGAIVGLAIMIGSEAATLANVPPFPSWNTPICWTGFILFADSLVYQARGESWLRSSPREFVLLSLASIPLWLVFEFYNLFIQNWHYVGLPENVLLRTFGYAWSFATIWPAIFEGADLIAVWRERRSRRRAAGWAKHGVHAHVNDGTRNAADRLARRPSGETPPPTPLRDRSLPGPGGLWIAAGVVMLVLPFVVPTSIARYLAAPVWLGFIVLLDPINARLGGETLLPGGRFDRVVNLGLSGFLCGALWEFWNYWATAKWHYTVPIMEHLKIFEMPVPGYFGFPAFALECFTMYVFLRIVAVRLTGHSSPLNAHLGRRIAL